jgi:ankyrin repeat protein
MASTKSKSKISFAKLAKALDVDGSVRLENLIKAGADPNVTDPVTGDSILSSAIQKGKFAHVEILMISGAIIKETDWPNVCLNYQVPSDTKSIALTALNCFDDDTFLMVIDYLSQRDLWHVLKILYTRFDRRDHVRITSTIKLIQNINATFDGNQHLLLTFVSYRPDYDMVKHLLENTNVFVNTVDMCNETALTVVCKSRFFSNSQEKLYLDLAQILLDHGADPTIRSASQFNFGLNALDLVEDRWPNMLDLLENYKK